MTWSLALTLLFGGILLLFLIGLPVAVAFLALNVLGAFVFMGGLPGLDQLARNTMLAVSTFSLTPIPLFVLMGEVLFQTGLAFKVIEGIERLIVRVPGRMAVVAVSAGTVFSAISGSTIATTAMLGSAMTPTMLKRGYHPSLAMGPIMAIGAVDMLIPPSGLTVLLGSLSGISISGLLIGGIIPGLILAVVFIAYIVLRLTGGALVRGVRETPLSPLDRLLGLGFGLVRALVLLGVFSLVFRAAVPEPEMPPWVKEARLYPLTVLSADALQALAPRGGKLADRITPALKDAIQTSGETSPDEKGDKPGK